MINFNEQVLWAQSLSDSLDDSCTSDSSVVGWIRSNLGRLNYNIGTDFQISGDPVTGDITPSMSQIQSGIYNEMYYCYWLQKKSRNIVGALEYDWVEMQGEDQGKIKRVTNTEKSKNYSALSKECKENLSDLLKEYKGGSYAIPRQILFNNRKSTPDNVTFNFAWSDRNPAFCE